MENQKKTISAKESIEEAKQLRKELQELSTTRWRQYIQDTFN